MSNYLSFHWTFHMLQFGISQMISKVFGLNVRAGVCAQANVWIFMNQHQHVCVHNMCKISQNNWIVRERNGKQKIRSKLCDIEREGKKTKSNNYNRVISQPNPTNWRKTKLREIPKREKIITMIMIKKKKTMIRFRYGMRDEIKMWQKKGIVKNRVVFVMK